jgi:Histidine kinase-, DNA gyrase B-, and HSP90-like ATPase
MSIVKIDSENNGSVGIAKSIDAGAQHLVFDILQNTQYSKPIESCIRETVSNSVDSLKEKNIARLILNGEAKVEDYYITRDGDEYRDSNFDPFYYDLNWLSNTNEASIHYVKREGIGFCDSVYIKDTGVGLSPYRFISLFSLGFSSKRNTNKGALGGFGLGAKSPLATGVEYFKVTTCYNGMRMEALCYKHKTDLVIGQFDENGNERNFVTITLKTGENLNVYYEKTEEKNNTIIEIPSKRISRDKYEQAVKSQLLYFKDVKFYVTDEYEVKNTVNFHANILYNSNNIIISDNHYYSKPHILIVKDEADTEAVCYGNIDFRELELEEMFSSVGVKCTIRSVIIDENGQEVELRPGIAVSPSRESIIWDEHTRNYIINKFKDVQEEASNLVADELKEDDFIVWLGKASNVLANSGSNPILHRMSRIIDKSSINPKYKKTSIRYTGNPSITFRGFDSWQVQKVTERNSSTNWNDVDTVNRVDRPKNFPTVFDKVIIKDKDFDKFTDMYICEEVLKNNYGFIAVSPIDEKVIEAWDEDLRKHADTPVKIATAEKEIRERKAYIKEITTYLEESKNTILYSSITVPKEYIESKKVKEQKIEAAKEAEKRLTPAEIRKLNAEVFYKKVYDRSSSPSDNYDNKREVDVNTYGKSIKQTDLKNAPKKFYYGTQEDIDVLNLAAQISYSVKNKPDLALISNANVKYFKNQNPIENFFNTIEKNKISMSKTMQGYYLSKLFNENIAKYSEIFENYKNYNLDVYEAYSILKNLAGDYKNVDFGKTTDLYNEVMKNCDTIFEMQTYILDNPNITEAEVAAKSLELFKNNMIKEATAVDVNLYKLYLELLDYLEPVKSMFKIINLNEADLDSQEAFMQYLDIKGLSSFTFKSSLLIKEEPETTSEEETVEEEDNIAVSSEM